MNDELRHALGQYFADKIQSNLRENENAENVLNILGKPFTEEQKKAETPTQQEINSLKSVEKVSSKGPYQLISKEDNLDNPAFDKLQNYIKGHNGFVVLHGLKCWNFNKSEKIGIRK